MRNHETWRRRDRLERPCLCAALDPQRRLNVHHKTRKTMQMYTKTSSAGPRRGASRKNAISATAASIVQASLPENNFCQARAQGPKASTSSVAARPMHPAMRRKSTYEIRTKEPETRMFQNVRQKKDPGRKGNSRSSPLLSVGDLDSQNAIPATEANCASRRAAYCDSPVITGRTKPATRLRSEAC